MGTQEVSGRVPAAPGSREPDQQAVPALSGFDPSREPKVLIFEDDPERKPRLYACPTCGSVHSPAIYLAREEVQHATAREAARDCYTCKTHNTCSYCGKDCDKGYTACHDCRYARKLEAAVEVADDGGPYCQFDSDTYYTSMEEAQDAGLAWVSPCTVTYPRIDPDSILESLLDEMHEDASVDDMDGVDEFYAAVKAFNDAQKCQSWFGDDKRKIRVPARDSDGSGEADETGTGSAVGDSAGRETASPNTQVSETPSDTLGEKA